MEATIVYYIGVIKGVMEKKMEATMTTNCEASACWESGS